MKGDALIATQRLMAQAIGAMADHIERSTGYQLTPVTFAELPSPPKAGMIACVIDSPVNSWGGIVGVGAGTHTALLFFDGTNWVVH